MPNPWVTAFIGGQGYRVHHDVGAAIDRSNRVHARLVKRMEQRAKCDECGHIDHWVCGECQHVMSEPIDGCFPPEEPPT